MARSFFQDFNRDDGSPVTVEYTWKNGSGGGASIVTSWPNTKEYDEMHAEINSLKERPVTFHYDPEADQLEHELRAAIIRAEEAAELTDDERDRMEAWLCEHHVDEPDDDIEF